MEPDLAGVTTQKAPERTKKTKEKARAGDAGEKKGKEQKKRGVKREIAFLRRLGKENLGGTFGPASAA